VVVVVGPVVGVITVARVHVLVRATRRTAGIRGRSRVCRLLLGMVRVVVVVMVRSLTITGVHIRIIVTV
jgi:hypothetical protein